MIPLAGMEILLWLIRFGLAVLVVSIVGAFAAGRSARRAWRAQEAGTTGERIALIVLVPGLVFFVLFFPPFNGRVLITSLIPALISLATLLLIRRGDRRRGLRSLGWRGTLSAALASLAGSVLLLLATFAAIRWQHARERRMEEARQAAGRANQDDFAALVVTDRGVAVAGESSTPPAQGDDPWVLSLDRSLALERRFSPIAPADQAFLALTADARGLVAGGRDDEHPVWLRLDALGDLTARRVWPWQGAVRGLAPLADGSTLVAGDRENAPFIARIEGNGTERWSAFPGTRGSLSAVVTDGRRYLAAGSDDVPEVQDSSMVLVGGTTDGRASWAKRFRSSRFLPEPHAMAITRGGVVLVLGTTSELPGRRMADLWLGRFSMDGTLLDERTFGGEFADAAGGLAVRNGRVFVAGYQFVPLQEKLWLFEVDDGGKQVWEKTYPAASHGRPAALAVDRDGNLVVAGFRQGADLHRDGWVAIFDSTGGLITQRIYP